MDYKVFISHSTDDQRLVVSLANLLSKYEMKVSVAEWYLTPGEPLTNKIFKQINESDCVVVLLTENGMRSEWVKQEIAIALNKRKIIIPLVTKGIRPNELAALQGREYIEFDPDMPRDALLKTSKYVKSLKLKKQDKEKALLIAGGIIAFLILLSGGKE
jgi:hypothetical protein